jgi:iron complex transport system substrate-binding protein
MRYRHLAATLCMVLCLIAAPKQSAARSASIAVVADRSTTRSITVVDDHGTTITLARTPRRLISLAPNVTEILFALGLGARVVGVSSYSDYPAAAAKLPSVISYTSLNIEKTLALKPDLLVAAAIVPQSIVDRLRALHLPVLVTDPHDLAGILADIRLVGRATGAADAAGSLVARLQARIKHVDALVRRAHSRPRVFYEIDPTLYTAGHGSFVDALITEAGGTNIAGRFGNPYPQISREALLAANPEVYVLGDTTAGVTPAAVAKRTGFTQLSAVRTHRVYPFNDDLASRPGPRIVDGLEALARLLHPELFK